MADALTPVLTDEQIVLLARRVGGLFDDLAIGFQTDDILNFGRSVLAAQAPAQPGDPVAWRSRHRSEIGMIGHYPWFFMERVPKSAMRGSFEVQPLYTHPAPSQPDRAVMQQALDALEAITRHFGLARLGESRLADSNVRCDAHAAMTALRAALSATMEKPNG